LDFVEIKIRWDAGPYFRATAILTYPPLPNMMAAVPRAIQRAVGNT
jgi:hypothetical protein